MSLEVFLAMTALVAAATLAAVIYVRDEVTRAALAIGGAALLLGIHAFGVIRFRADDAYITYRYARNLANGLGPVWNEGERVEGYTSFLWMLLLASLNVVGVDIEVGAALLAIASMLALLVSMWRVCQRLIDDEQSAGLVLAGSALLVAASASIGAWSMSGLEVPLIAALLMMLVLTYQRETRAASVLPVSAPVLVAGVMTRPEMNLIAGITGAFFLGQAILERDPRRWRQFALFAATFLLVAGAWFLWRWSYYGYIFPNTYYAKVGPTELMVERGFDYVRGYAWTYLLAPALAAGAILPFLVRGAARRDAALLAAITWGWTLVVIFEGGDGFFRARFLAPVLPVAYIALVACCAQMLRRLRQPSRVTAAGLAAGLVAASLFLASSSGEDTSLEVNQRTIADWRITGQWLRQNAPPGHLVAVYAAGVTPYFSHMPSLDMLGLTDETIAHADVPEFGSGTPGHEKYDLDYALDVRNPEIIMVGGVFPRVTTRDEFVRGSSGGPVIVPGYTALINDPRTWERYEMAAFFYQDRWYNFLLRKDILSTVNVGWTESEGLINGGRGRR